MIMTDTVLDVLIAATKELLFIAQLREPPCGECVMDCRIPACPGCRLRWHLCKLRELQEQRKPTT